MKNFKSITKVVFILLIMFVAIEVSAQTDSLEIHKINGKDYYIHIVEKGQSLYFIHQKYDVPMDVIKTENPGVLDGLSIGEKIFIPVKKDSLYETKTNGNFINHEVQKSQTLYSIANLYHVKQQEIIAANPEITEGLKEGQIIRIPVTGIMNNSANTTNQASTQPKYKTHVVSKGETLYSLSKLYHTTVDSILLINDGLNQGLKAGETINLPIKLKNTETIVENSLLSNNIIGIQPMDIDTNVVKKDEYAIALLLPFFFDENDEITQHRSILEEKTIYPKSKFAIEFYNGFLTAMDSLTSSECRFKLYVFDTYGSDSARINNILLKPELKKVDMIVGPLYEKNFNYVAEFALENHIPVIAPVKQNNKTLLGNEYIFKVVPSKSSTLNQICSLVVDSFKTENLLAIEYEKAKEKPLVDLYVKAYNNLILNSEDTTLYSSIKTLKINYNISDVVANLRRDKNNVIFVPVTEQTFVTSLFSLLSTTLNKRNYKDYRITLIGLEEWIKFENIDLEYFQQLNVHYCDERYIDYNDSLTSLFINNYVQKNETYPSSNTLLGFDLAYYFGGNLKHNGTLFSEESLKYYQGMSIQFNFLKTGVESGYENTGTNILRFYDYTIERIVR